MTNSQSHRPRVVISNVYPDDNRGGAAITQAAIDIAREAVPGAEITLLAVAGTTETLGTRFRFTTLANPDVEILPPMFTSSVTTKTGSARALAASLLCLAWPSIVKRGNPAVQRIASAELVMGKGGQAFRNARTPELLSLWFTAAPLIMAQRMGRPTALVAASVGPFDRSRLIRALAGIVLRRLTVVMPRGHRSATTLRDLGVRDDRIRVVPDSVFRFAPPERSLTERMLREYGLRDKSFLAVTLTSNMGRPDLRPTTFPALALIVRSALAKSLVERVVVVVQTDGLTTDLPVSAEFVDYVGDERVSLISKQHSTSELMALYGGATATIGGRVHSAVFSIVAGTLAFPIEFGGDKSRDIFGPSYAERILHPLTEPAEAMCERVLAILGDVTTMEQALRDDATERRDAARDTERSLKAMLRSSK